VTVLLCLIGSEVVDDFVVSIGQFDGVDNNMRANFFGPEVIRDGINDVAPKPTRASIIMIAISATEC